MLFCRICGLAHVDRLAFQPLTPMFHMLDMRPGQSAYMDQLARAFEASRHLFSSVLICTGLHSLLMTLQSEGACTTKEQSLTLPLMVSHRCGMVSSRLAPPPPDTLGCRARMVENRLYVSFWSGDVCILMQPKDLWLGHGWESLDGFSVVCHHL